jgi:hypothetical protein
MISREHGFVRRSRPIVLFSRLLVTTLEALPTSSKNAFAFALEPFTVEQTIARKPSSKRHLEGLMVRFRSSST